MSGYTPRMHLSKTKRIIAAISVLLALGAFAVRARAVDGSTVYISEDTVWSAEHGPYVIPVTLEVSEGATLTVLPGTVVKFGDGASLVVAGALDANGTDAAPVRFTSVKDDSVGGDTNVDGSASVPHEGDYLAIVVRDAARAGFDHAEIRYANMGITAAGGEVSVRNSSISDTTHGLRQGEGSLVLEGNSFSDNYIPVNIGFNVAFEHADNEFSGNFVNGIGLSSYSDTVGDLVFSGDDAPYYLLGEIIMHGHSMLFEPGAELLLPPHADPQIIMYGGTISAIGKEDDWITIEPHIQTYAGTQAAFEHADLAYMDFVGNAALSMTDCISAGFRVGDHSRAVVYDVEFNLEGTVVQAIGLSHLDMEQSTIVDPVPNTGPRGALSVDSASVAALTDVAIASVNTAVSVYGQSSLDGLRVGIMSTHGKGIDLGSDLLQATDASWIKLRQSRITGSKYGLFASDMTQNLDIEQNSITGNEYGAYNRGVAFSNFPNNWWGHASGPYSATANSSGQGDRVSYAIGFAPWLTHDPAPEIEFPDLEAPDGQEDTDGAEEDDTDQEEEEGGSDDEDTDDDDGSDEETDDKDEADGGQEEDEEEEDENSEEDTEEEDSGTDEETDEGEDDADTEEEGAEDTYEEEDGTDDEAEEEEGETADDDSGSGNSEPGRGGSIPLPMPQPIPSARNPVLVVPGVLGTELSLSGETLWLDLARTAREPGDRFMDPLAFGSDLLPSVPGVRTESVIGSKLPVLGMSVFNYSSALIAELSSRGYREGTDLFLFPYDWRYGVARNASALAVRIAEILQATGARKVDIVAHSAGGLIVKRYAIEHQTDARIGKAVLVGVPNTGAPEALETLLDGSSFGVALLSDRQIKKIAGNMPMIYDLLPSPRYIAENGGVLVAPGSLSYAETAHHLVSSAGLNSRALSDAEALHSDAFDNYDLRSAGVDPYVIAGCRAGTLGALREVRLPGGIPRHILSREVAGDGTVPFSSAADIPVDTGKKLYALTGKHATLLGEPGVRRAVASILAGIGLPAAEEGMSSDAGRCGLDGKLISVFGPLALEVVDQAGRTMRVAAGEDSLPNDIPNADMRVIGGYAFAYLPTGDGEQYILRAVATDAGPLEIAVETILRNAAVRTDVIGGITLTPGATGRLYLGEPAHFVLDADTTAVFSVVADGHVASEQKESFVDAERDMQMPLASKDPDINLYGAAAGRGGARISTRILAVAFLALAAIAYIVRQRYTSQK